MVAGGGSNLAFAEDAVEGEDDEATVETETGSDDVADTAPEEDVSLQEKVCLDPWALCYIVNSEDGLKKKKKDIWK